MAGINRPPPSQQPSYLGHARRRQDRFLAAELVQKLSTCEDTMSNVVKLFRSHPKTPSTAKHTVRMRVRGRVPYPEMVRAAACVPIYRASGFGAAAGFTDNAARTSTAIEFYVRPALLGRFQRDIRPLIEMELVSVRIDNVKLRYSRHRARR